MKLTSLFNQIQDLKYIPHHRVKRTPDARDGAEERALRWNGLTKVLRALHTEIVHLQLSQGDEERIAVLEAEAAGIETTRNKLKEEYWTSASSRGAA